MVWLEFVNDSAVEQGATNVFLGQDIQVRIRLCTRPPVEGMQVVGRVTYGDSESALAFAPAEPGVYVSLFKPTGEGAYTVTVYTNKPSYQSATLSKIFYCR